MIFRNLTHRDIWIDHHCNRCHHGQQTAVCPILARAITSDRKPVEWDRNTRKNATMAESIKCNSETRLPPRDTRPVVDVDVPMFDVTATVDMDADHA